MSERPPISPERLAALLDGRLGAAEASALREQLASADAETLSAYADAVAIARELDGTSGDASARESSTAGAASLRARRRWLVPATAIAAAVATFAVLRSGSSTPDYPPARFANAIPREAIALTAPAWSAARGADQLTGVAVATRVGSLLASLEVSAVRGTTTPANLEDLAGAIEHVPGGAVPAAQLRGLVSGSGASIARARVSEIGQECLALVDRQVAIAGAYLEAARMATAVGDTAFFDRVPASVVFDLRSRPNIDPAIGSLIDTFGARLKAKPRDASAISAAAGDLLRALAR